MGIDRKLSRWLWPFALCACAYLAGCDDDDDDDVDARVPLDARIFDAPMGMDAPTADAPTGDAPAGPVMVVDCATVTPAETVVMDNIAFMPNEVEIAAGEVVMFSNEDGVAHTVTSGNPDDPDAGTLFDVEDIQPGESVCLSFSTVGDFELFCELHPVMMQDGLVTVTNEQ